MTTPTPSPSPRFSSSVASGLQRFLESKRAAGYRYDAEAEALVALDRFLATHVPSDDPVISFEVIRGFVARRGQESETTRGHRLSLIRQVCLFLALEQPRTAVPDRRFLPIVRRRFLARVLSREEGRRFLQACETLPNVPWSPLRQTTLGTALVLLYLTGLRAGEAVRLTDANVDLDAGVLRICGTKFGKSRCVPIAPDLAARLRDCRASVARHLGLRLPDALFFPTASGRRYSLTALRWAFHQVLDVAGIPRRSCEQSLRLHDLRHSFVVLRLLLWYEQGADLNARLPLLATYLGHVGLSGTQRYLQLTQDMVGEITRRHAARFGYLVTERSPV